MTPHNNKTQLALFADDKAIISESSKEEQAKRTRTSSRTGRINTSTTGC